MNSLVKPLKRIIQNGHTLSIGLRFLLLLIAIGIQMIYIPTSNRLTGGIEPKLPIDIFPTWHIWVLPYVLCYPLWIAGVLWATLRMEDRLFRSFITAVLLTFSLAMLIFIFFPTYVPALTFPAQQQDILTHILRHLHEIDGRYDAFPSGHVYITVLLALFYNAWYPRYKFYWILIPVTVALSTLFTHQHYIVDVIGGLVVALIGYHIGMRWMRFSPIQNRPTKTGVLQPPS